MGISLCTCSRLIAIKAFARTAVSRQSVSNLPQLFKRHKHRFAATMSSQESSDRGSSTDEEMRDAQDRIRMEGLSQQSPPSTPPQMGNRRPQGSLRGAARLEPVQRLVGVTQLVESIAKLTATD